MSWDFRPVHGRFSALAINCAECLLKHALKRPVNEHCALLDLHARRQKGYKSATIAEDE